MRFEEVTLEELKTNFEAALIAAEKGVPPKTAQGFDGKTFDALHLLASARDGQRAGRMTAARRAFADQLAGNHLADEVDKLLAGQ